MSSASLVSRVVKWQGHAILALLARFYLAVVFAEACWHKLLSPETFAIDVATYQFLPLWSLNGFALVVPWVEALTALLFFLGLRVRAASLLISLMMVSFIVALFWALHLGLDMSCGCFASQAAVKDDPISSLTVARDLGWLALGLYVFIFDRCPLGLDRILLRKGIPC